MFPHEFESNLHRTLYHILAFAGQSSKIEQLLDISATHLDHLCASL